MSGSPPVSLIVRTPNRAATAATHRGAGVLGLVVVGAHARGQQEALAKRQRIEHVGRGRGGLAVRAGDPDDDEVPGRVVVDVGGDLAEQGGELARLRVRV